MMKGATRHGLRVSAETLRTRTRHGAASRRVGPDGYARSAVRQLRKSAGLLVGEVPA